MVTETVERSEARLEAAATDAERITALNALAWELRTVDLRRALTLSEEAVRLARAAGGAPLLAPSLCLLGVCASILSQHQEALGHLEESLTLSRRIGDLHTEGRCLQYIGRSRFLLGDCAAGIESAAASTQIRKELGDGAGLGACLNLTGNIYHHLCDYGQALDWYTQGLETRERAGDVRGVSESLCNIGSVYAGLKDHTQALGFHRRSLEHGRRIGDPRAQFLGLCKLGEDYLGLGRYEEALEVSRQAVSLGETLDAAEILTMAYANIGQVHARSGQRAEALDQYARALEVAHSIGEQDLAARILCDMGLILTEQGELEGARARLTQAAVLGQSVDARGTAAYAAEGLSEVCKRLGDYAAALGHYEDFHRIEKEIFSGEADKRAKALVVQMEVDYHRREAAALAEANAALQRTNAALAEANARLESLATTDPLTGLPNHRALVAALDAETARVRREGGACALLFLDIDHFKGFNDTHGHPVGDAVLREFAGVVRACLREADTLGRWGGEEFLALLPGTDVGGAAQAGERVRAAVAAHALAVGKGLHMTCSVGAVACPPQEPVRDALVKAADQALYAAKRLGRNRVCLAGDPAPPAAASPTLSPVRAGA